MAFKIEGKEIYPIFVFTKCCCSVVRLGKNALIKQRKATPTQPLQFHVKFMHMPSEFSIYVVYFSTYGSVWSNIRNSLDVEKVEKLIKIYRFYRAEEDNQ